MCFQFLLLLVVASLVDGEAVLNECAVAFVIVVLVAAVAVAVFNIAVANRCFFAPDDYQQAPEG